MKDKKIKVGDWVIVTKVGLTERYMVESIENDFYIVIQKEGTYVHTLKVKRNQINKL